jgi:hypothetical protein
VRVLPHDRDARRHLARPAHLRPKVVAETLPRYAC